MQLKGSTPTQCLSSIYPFSVERSQLQTVARNLNTIPFSNASRPTDQMGSFDEDDREELDVEAETIFKIS